MIKTENYVIIEKGDHIEDYIETVNAGPCEWYRMFYREIEKSIVNKVKRTAKPVVIYIPPCPPGDVSTWEVHKDYNRAVEEMKKAIDKEIKDLEEDLNDCRDCKERLNSL